MKKSVLKVPFDGLVKLLHLPHGAKIVAAAQEIYLPGEILLLIEGVGDEWIPGSTVRQYPLQGSRINLFDLPLDELKER